MNKWLHKHNTRVLYRNIEQFINIISVAIILLFSVHTRGRNRSSIFSVNTLKASTTHAWGPDDSVGQKISLRRLLLRKWLS